MALSTSVLVQFLARNRSAAGIASFNRGLMSSTRHLRRLMTSVLAFAGVAGIGYMLKRQMEAIDSMAKLSDRIGITTEALAGLQYGAQIMGVETGTLNKALEIFSRRIGEVQMGTGEAKRVLDDLGLSATQLANIPLDQSLGLIADRISALQTKTEKAAKANYLFGRSGQQLLNFFETGSRGMAEFQEFAEKAGLAISRIDASQVEAANDALARTHLIFTGLFRRTVVELAPYIDAAATSFVNWATQGEGVGVKVTGAFEVATLSVIEMGNAIEAVVIQFDKITLSMKTLKGVGESILVGISRGAVALARKLPAPKGAAPIPKQDFPTFEELPSIKAAADLQVKILEAQAAGAERISKTRARFAKIRSQAWVQAMATQAERWLTEPGKDLAGPLEAAAESQMSAARKRMDALRAQVREEINLLGRLNEPRQHARMLVEFQAQAALEYTDAAHLAEAATAAFRMELERLEQAESLARIAESIGQAFSTAFEDAILEAKNLNDVMIALSRTIQRAIFQEFVSRPLSMAITGAIGRAIMPAPAAAVVAHGAGRIGDISDRRWVSSSIFENAPRFDDLKPGEMAVIAQPDEVISRPGSQPTNGLQITNIFNLQMIDQTGGRRFIDRFAHEIAQTQQAANRDNVGR